METPQQPQYQSPVMPRPIMPQSTHKAWTISLVIVLLLVGGYFAFAKYQSMWPFSTQVAMKNPSPTSIISVSSLPSITPDPIVGWKTYQNVKTGFAYRYPAELVASENYPVAVKTISDFRAEYSSANYPDECPGTCGSLLNPQTLEKQFNILKTAQSCEMSDSFKEDIKKNLILFGGGIYSIIDVEKIYSPYLKICGLKILDYGAYDVDLNAYGYKDIFLSGDKVISISISPFSLKEATAVWNGFGSTKTSSGATMCDTSCSTKMTTYYNRVSRAPLANSIIRVGRNIVDQILSTFKFAQ